jgi:transcription elongation factor GreA
MMAAAEAPPLLRGVVAIDTAPQLDTVEIHRIVDLLAGDAAGGFESPAAAAAHMSVVTILFAGDDPDDAETYLIGHIEEKRTDGVSADVMSPVSPIGGALLGHKAGDDVSVTLENGAKVSVTIVKVDN